MGILSNILEKKQVCEHNQNVVHRKFHLEDGTPIIDTRCSCGYRDYGHVYGDAQNWKDETIIIKNGVKC